MRSNVHIVIEKIEAAPIPDAIKKKATKEICKLASDRRYARHCQFQNKRNGLYPGLDGLMIWSKTNVGYKFWAKLNVIIR
jgi:hypothetical protein